MEGCWEFWMNWRLGDWLDRLTNGYDGYKYVRREEEKEGGYVW